MGNGCARCPETGYTARTGVFETLVLDARIRDLILRGATEEDIRIAAQESGMRILVEDGREKAKAGITTIEELGRIIEVSEYAADNCPGCGRHLNSEYPFCRSCRAVLRRICTGCVQPLPSGSR